MAKREATIPIIMPVLDLLDPPAYIERTAKYFQASHERRCVRLNITVYLSKNEGEFE